MKKNYYIAETFVGAGGNHIGWTKAGFNSVYINDFDKNMLDTIKYNNKKSLANAYIDNSSILDLDISMVKKIIRSKTRDLDVLFGGIVCKGFSLAGDRNPMDERNYFYLHQLNLVKELMPKISVIENVTGILSARVIRRNAPNYVKSQVNQIWSKITKNKFQRSQSNKIKISAVQRSALDLQFKELTKQRKELMKSINDMTISVMDHIKQIYKKLGYNIYIKTLSSWQYSVSTTRKRVFIVAIRSDIKGDYEFPKPTRKTPIKVSHILNKITISKYDNDSLPMNHSDKVVKRFSYIPQGGNLADILDKLPKELRINKFFSRGANQRLDPNKPAPTLVPGHSAFILHTHENRSITVREAASITGFPDKYKFFGSHSKRCEQVGNAIPPKLAEAVAKSVIMLLYEQ